MVVGRIPTLRSPSPTGIAVLLLLNLTGCEVPNFEGAQIQNPPRRFMLQNDSYQQRRMFPERDVSRHIAWIEASDGPYSGIYINAHPGALTMDDVLLAREAAGATAENPETTFDEVERMTIDGRPAWGWAERLETPELGLDWVAYRTVVSFDTVPYAIEFYSGDPGIKRAAPDTLKTVLASFAIGETTWSLPLVAPLAGIMLFAVSVLRSGTREKAARLQGINLVTIPRKKEDEGARVPESPRTPTAPPPPPAAPTELRQAVPRPGDGSATSAPPDTENRHPRQP